MQPGKNSHFVFVTDHNGIDSVFELLKSKLKNELNSCLSLVYSITEHLPLPLFKAELESLEKRYPSQLITYYVFNKNAVAPENSELNQQILEIVINCNTCDFMEFMIMGHEDLVPMVIDRLQFLGIKSNQINSKII